ncbi:hypothetical protein ANCCAN_23704 [Ancylostoma caninum]|uniref:Uncharacterized protein n=1 Tax=Ancylostoma caninum TaxID=29170 RepID=A0A368FI02_ANCCA|nr:hypothetical protein ANCCAN_23704 [Ancylostoma caninum]
MVLCSGLVLAALCLLHIASSTPRKGDVPKCEELGMEALSQEDRDTSAVRLKEAMKNAEYTVSCGSFS